MDSLREIADSRALDTLYWFGRWQYASACDCARDRGEQLEMCQNKPTELGYIWRGVKFEMNLLWKYR